MEDQETYKKSKGGDKKMKTICVTIEEDQHKWFKDHCINISSFLRKEMDEFKNFTENKEIDVSIDDKTMEMMK